MILTDIVDAIRSRGNGFLRKNTDTGEWMECSDVLCREKVGQYFRSSLGGRFKSRSSGGSISSSGKCGSNSSSRSSKQSKQNQISILEGKGAAVRQHQQQQQLSSTTKEAEDPFPMPPLVLSSSAVPFAFDHPPTVPHPTHPHRRVLSSSAVPFAFDAAVPLAVDHNSTHKHRRVLSSSAVPFAFEAVPLAVDHNPTNKHRRVLSSSAVPFAFDHHPTVPHPTHPHRRVLSSSAVPLAVDHNPTVPHRHPVLHPTMPHHPDDTTSTSISIPTTLTNLVLPDVSDDDDVDDNQDEHQDDDDDDDDDDDGATTGSHDVDDNQDEHQDEVFNRTFFDTNDCDVSITEPIRHMNMSSVAAAVPVQQWTGSSINLLVDSTHTVESNTAAISSV